MILYLCLVFIFLHFILGISIGWTIFWLVIIALGHGYAKNGIR